MANEVRHYTNLMLDAMEDASRDTILTALRLLMQWLPEDTIEDFVTDASYGAGELLGLVEDDDD